MLLTAAGRCCGCAGIICFFFFSLARSSSPPEPDDERKREDTHGAAQNDLQSTRRPSSSWPRSRRCWPGNRANGTNLLIVRQQYTTSPHLYIASILLWSTVSTTDRRCKFAAADREVAVEHTELVHVLVLRTGGTSTPSTMYRWNLGHTRASATVAASLPTSLATTRATLSSVCDGVPSLSVTTRRVPTNVEHALVADHRESRERR